MSDALTAQEQAVMLAMLDVPEFREAWCIDGKDLSLEDLGCVMGLSRVSVLRVEESALRKIRRALLDDPETLAILQLIYFQSKNKQ